jgi:hypothetical protein
MVRWTREARGVVGLAAAVLAAAALAAGCSRAGDEAGTKRSPSQPPPRSVEIPSDLSIAVTVDGAAHAAITAETLRGIHPDFADDERRAWRVPTLLPEAERAGSVVEAVSPAGVGVRFEHRTADGLEPVLFLTRRGEVMVAAVDPKDPFPRYHGQGGRLRRGGDPMPRVAPVARLAVTH